MAYLKTSTCIGKQQGLAHVLPDSFGFEVDVWIAMHSDLRRIKHIVRVFDVLGEALHGYLSA